MIHEKLKALEMDIEKLAFDPGNVRKHNDKNIKAIEKSLKKFGQRIPIVVQKKGLVVRAGNGRLEAAKNLGWDKIAALVIDESNTDAEAFAVADNRTSELASWDFDALEKFFESVTSESIVGFDEAEIERLLNPKNDFLTQEVDQSLFEEFKHECPKCGFKYD